MCQGKVKPKMNSRNKLIYITIGDLYHKKAFQFHQMHFFTIPRQKIISKTLTTSSMILTKSFSTFVNKETIYE